MMRDALHRVGFVLMAVFSVVMFTPQAHAAQFERSLNQNGETRTYTLISPDARPAGTKLPVVIVLHGGGGNGQSAIAMSGFSSQAMSREALLVFPDGSGRLKNKMKTWNAGHCCGYAMRQDADDVGFISAMIDALVREEDADPKRIYVTGISNGAMMTHRLAIALPDKIAAIAPVVGGMFGDEATPAGPVPALIINGARDESVPMAGGPTGGLFASAWDGTPLKPAAYQGAFWAAANGCGDTPVREVAPGGKVITWRYDCPNGADVVQVIVNDNGHAWPGGQKGRARADAPSQSFDATAQMWTFFKGRSR